jgi:hypothetical protein
MKTYSQFIKAGASELLRGIAYDMAIIYDEMGCAANCKSLWDDAKRIEKRFGLMGSTGAMLQRFEDNATFNKAVRKIQAVNGLFEPCEIDRMSKSSAQGKLRDLLRTYGRLSFCERFGNEAFNTALNLTT